MSVIREPIDIDFTVVPVKLTAKDKREISEFIAQQRRQKDHSEMVREAQEILSRYEERQQLKSRAAIKPKEKTLRRATKVART